MINDIEIWKPVVGFEEFYEVSTFGRVKSLVRLKIYKGKRERQNHLTKEIILKPHKTMEGYWNYMFYDNDKNKKIELSHRAVAKAFIPNIENKLYVNHKDGNRANHHISNLEWVTHSENMKDSFTRPRNIRSYKRDDIVYTKIKSTDLDLVIEMWKNSVPYNDIAKLYNITISGLKKAIATRIGTSATYKTCKWSEEKQKYIPQRPKINRF